MNAVTKNFTDVLRHPSARLTQHFRIWIGKRALELDVLDFRVRGGLCKDYKVDITVTSPQLNLDGKDYVGLRAGLQVDERASVPSASWTSPVDHAAATLNGVATRWKRIRTSRDEAAYQIRLEPRFAALCKRIIRSDVMKNVTFEEMVRQLMVDGQNFDAFDIEFHLEGPQEKMEQVVMYEESVWNFITRHAKRKGIFWFYRQERGENGLLDILVFADNPRAYIRSVNLPLLAGSGLNSNWHEAAQAVHEQRELVAATIEVWERNYRTPEDPLRATANVSDDADDRSVFGQISCSTEFHLTQGQGEALAQARRDEQVARQVTLAGRTDAKGIAPGVVIRLTNATMPSAKYGFVVTSFRMKGSRTKPVYTRFKAMPAHLTRRDDHVLARRMLCRFRCHERHAARSAGQQPGVAKLVQPVQESGLRGPIRWLGIGVRRRRSQLLHALQRGLQLCDRGGHVEVRRIGSGRRVRREEQALRRAHRPPRFRGSLEALSARELFAVEQVALVKGRLAVHRRDARAFLVPQIVEHDLRAEQRRAPDRVTEQRIRATHRILMGMVVQGAADMKAIHVPMSRLEHHLGSRQQGRMEPALIR